MDNREWIEHLGEAENEFDLAWEILAQSGKVDGRGGHEYLLVFRMWIQSHCPVEIEAFITERTAAAETTLKRRRRPAPSPE